MRKLWILLIGLVMLVSCSKNKTSNDTTKGNKRVITFNIESEPKSLDPQLLTDMGGWIIASLAFENLVRLDENNEIIAAGAENFDVSEDGTKLTFYLRKEAKWSNGDPVIAQDYYRGIMRGINPETLSEYSFMTYYIKGAEAYNIGEGKAEDVGVKVIDDYTLEIELEKPAPYFIKTLISPIYAPIHKDAIEKYGSNYMLEAENAIYNGAYVISSWEHDDSIVLEKNEHYWNKNNIHLDKLVALMITDFDSAAKMYENKELDFTKINSESVKVYDGKEELKMFSNGRVYYLAFNPNIDIFKNKKIKQAITLAIDREKLVSQVLGNGSIVGSGIVAPGVPGLHGDFREENGNLYEQYKNIDVNALFEEGLKEVGKEKKDVHIKFLIDEKGTAKKEAEFIQEELRSKLGIVVEVETLTYKMRLEKAKAGNYEMVRYSWGPDFSDPMTYLTLQYSKSTGFNISLYDNPEYDKLIEFAQSSIDHEKRMEAMKEAEKMAAADFPYGGLYYESAPFLINPRVKNVIIRTVGAPYDFYFAKLD